MSEAAILDARGDPSALELVQPEILSGFSALVRELGGSPDALLRDVGLDPIAFEDGRDRASYRQHVALLTRAAELLDRADFGMRLAIRQRGWRIYGPLGPVMRHSPNLRDALDYVATHVYAHSLAARIRVQPLPDGRGVVCCHDILLTGIANPTQAIEHVLLVGNLGMLEMTGGRAHARRVHFRHQPVAPLRTYRRHFGCDVLFGQDEDGLVLSEADIASPIAAPDADAYRAATELVETGFAAQIAPLSTQVRGLVLQHLGGGGCTNARIAAELGLHIRTLRRRLALESTSFQAIKDGVRRDRLHYYLRHTRLELGRISERLDFAEQSIMSRRCRTWFGCSPTQMRADADHDKRGAPDVVSPSGGRGGARKPRPRRVATAVA